MDVGMLIAGIITVALGFGHTAVGVIWVLPHLTPESLPRTPFGPSAMSVSMVRVSWYIVTIFALASGGILITLALETGADAMTVLLRWFAAMWLAATVMAFWVGGGVRTFRHVVRLPVPLFWMLIAVLCWKASM